MDMPDFGRAEYLAPEPAPGSIATVEPPPIPDNLAFSRALLFGAGAAIVGSLIYALVGLWIQIGFVSILVGGMVGTAMMRGSRGLGGRRYQVAAILLTYFAVSLAGVIDALWHEAHRVDIGTYIVHNIILLAILVLIGPILELFGNIGGGLLGLIILFFGLQAAWKIAKGGPGFAVAPPNDTEKPLGLTSLDLTRRE